MVAAPADESTGPRYADLGLIAAGGMAQVHLARRDGPAGFRKLVALKRVLPQFAHDPSFDRMFLNEARLAAGLDHSNLVKVLDFGLLGGRYFLAMEYVHGHDLRSVLHRAGQTLPGGVLPMECSVHVVQSVAAGLHYAHERCGGVDGRPLGLVHRDVSPSNILVSFEGEVKLSDFGIAKATSKVDITATTTLRGKLAYMSPEQARGEPVDRRSDIFALGIILFELTTGYRQFTGDNQYQLLNRVADGEITLPRELVPDYPPALEAIVARALAADPNARYQAALELHEALGRFAADNALRPEGPRLARLLVSMFGQRPLPSLDARPESTIPLGYATRPAAPPPRTSKSVSTGGRRRGRWGVAASLAIGVGLGLGIARAMAGGDVSTEEPAEDATAAPPSEPAPTAATPSPAAPAPRRVTDTATKAASIVEPRHPATDDVGEQQPTGVRSSRRRGRRKQRPARPAEPVPKPEPEPEPKPRLEDWALPKAQK